MSGVSNYFNNSTDYSSLFTSMNGGSSGLDLTDYAAIRNGSYGKLMKAYYKNQDSQKSAKSASDNQDSKQMKTLMKTKASDMKKSVDALMDSSLWEKKVIKKKDEKTGQESEVMDYDWETITKKVKDFTDAYNGVIGKAADSKDKNILRNAAQMTSVSGEMSKLLNEVGIKIGTDNKLEVDEEKLKSASIGTLKTLFTGMHSFADKMAQKATAIVRTVSGASNTYTSNANYSNTLSKLVSGKVDEEV